MTNWVSSRKFRLIKEPTRHYVLQHNNAGNTEINVPMSIADKLQAQRWLRAHPNAVKNPTRFKPKRAPPRFRLASWLDANPNWMKGTPSPWHPTIKSIPFSPRRLSSPPPNYKYQAISPPMNASEYPNWNSSCVKLRASLKTFKPIGKGRQGVVFLASKYASARSPFAVKVAPRDLSAKQRGEPQPVDVEYNIQSAVQNCSPYIVKVFKSIRCLNFVEPVQINAENLQNASKFDKSQQGIIFMEYAGGGSLDKWLASTKQVDDLMMYNLISNILGAISGIQKKYPDFRHNDLHMQNVFVTQRGFLMGDFGWARLKKSGTNPAVNTANGTKTASHWGVGPKTDARYDQHLFLNELLQWAMKHHADKHPKAIAFLKKAIPPGYRGEENTHVNQWRLKYGDAHPDLPSLDEIMTFSFMKQGKKRVSSPNLMAVKAKLKATGRKLSLARNKSPVVKKALRPTAVNLQVAKAKLKKTTARPMVSPAKLREAKAKLKPARPLRKLNASQLKAGKAKLKPAVKTKPLARNLFKNAKFDKLVEWYWKNNGAKSGANYDNAWTKARAKATRLVEIRLHRGNVAFSPNKIGGSVRKVKTVTQILAIPRGASATAASALPAKNLEAAAARMRQRAANLAAKRPKMIVTTKVPNSKKSAHEYSPTSGRIKVRGPTGRLAYVNGAAISMNFLKNLARQRGKNITGLRSKVEIAKRIFSGNKK